MTVAARGKRTRGVSRPSARRLEVKGRLWAVAQVAIIGLEVFVLLIMLGQPSFRPRDLQVTGLRHLTPADVTAALALPKDRSIFLLSHRALEARLMALPWVRSATVTMTLPDRLRVAVAEWSPAAVLEEGEHAYYLNEHGTVLGPAPEAGALPLIGRPGFGAVHAGQDAVAPEVLQLLIPLQRGFPAAFKVKVLSFSLDRQEVLTLRTDRGWTLVFGQVATADQRATLEEKVGALRALATRLDLSSAPIVYINLMNPRAPAVQLKR